MGLCPMAKKTLDLCLRPETSLLLSKQNAVALARNLAGGDQRIQRPIKRSPGNAQRTGQRAEIAYLQNAALLLLLSIGQKPALRRAARERLYLLVEKRDAAA